MLEKLLSLLTAAAIVIPAVLPAMPGTAAKAAEFEDRTTTFDFSSNTLSEIGYDSHNITAEIVNESSSISGEADVLSIKMGNNIRPQNSNYVRFDLSEYIGESDTYTLSCKAYYSRGSRVAVGFINNDVASMHDSERTYTDTSGTLISVGHFDNSNFLRLFNSKGNRDFLSTLDNNTWISISINVNGSYYSYTVTGDKSTSGSGEFNNDQNPNMLEIVGYSPSGSYAVDIDDLTIECKDAPKPSQTPTVIKYQDTERKMEKLDRGTVAAYTGSGVYLSWRLLGTESLEDQAFDIYRNGEKIWTTGPHDPTNYIDANGDETDSYIVVPKGETITGETAVSPWTNYTHYSAGSYLPNYNAYIDIPITRPDPVINAGGITSYYYKDNNGNGGANDASVGDIDGDGEYEIILKWDPNDSRDSGDTTPGYSGRVYIDAYEIDPNNNGYKWRIDLGPNIRAGAHYTQFIVYDLDSDGKAEIAMKTAPGSTDGNGEYVTEAGDTEEIRNADNSAIYVNDDGRILDGPEYLTIFNGETGEAMYTTKYDPPRDIVTMDKNGWGDNYGNRSERFLACAAYLDGAEPSLVMIRGYYTHAYFAAYTWDGTELKQQWLSANNAGSSTVTYNDGTAAVTEDKTLYGQGNHNLSVSDVDNDGKDEIVFGSGVLDDDGTVLYSTGHGHGDAMHVSDFDNDGDQEIFQVHEDNKQYGAELRDGKTGTIIAAQEVSGDNGRGIMSNFYDSGDTYAQFYSAGVDGVYGLKDGSTVETLDNSKPDGFINFALYWDDDLGREALDGNKLGKLSEDGFNRFVWDRDVSYFPDSSANNDSKNTPCLSADIFGDWREEVIFKINSGEDGSPALRIFTSAKPTKYRLFTLMHDSQYRLGVAWQNVGYNQPPHTSYYIGSKALAVDENGKVMNYLAPETAYAYVDPAEPSADTAKPPTVDVTFKSYDNNDDNALIFDNTISLNGNTVEADDITVTFNNTEAVRFSDKFREMSFSGYGCFTFTSAVTGIPDDAGESITAAAKVTLDGGVEAEDSCTYDLGQRSVVNEEGDHDEQ